MAVVLYGRMYGFLGVCGVVPIIYTYDVRAGVVYYYDLTLNAQIYKHIRIIYNVSACMEGCGVVEGFV